MRLSFTRRSYVEENIRLFLDFLGRVGDTPNIGSSYFAGLNAIQRYKIPPRRESDEWFFLFDLSDSDTQRLVERFHESGDVSPGDEILAQEGKRIIANLKAGLNVLKEYNQEAAQIAKLLVAGFVFAQKAGFAGGSVSSQLGIVWINPPASWTESDYAETLLHESTHQAQFLDQMVRGWYIVDAFRMAQPDAQVISPIRRVKRPFSLSFEAACVAVTLLDFHEQLYGSDRADDLCQSLVRTLVELSDRSQFLTEHGQQLLDEFNQTVLSSPSFARLQATVAHA
jgi:HEXXH motif-containing protein